MNGIDSLLDIKTIVLITKIVASACASIELYIDKKQRKYSLVDMYN